MVNPDQLCYGLQLTHTSEGKSSGYNVAGDYREFSLTYTWGFIASSITVISSQTFQK